MPSFGYPPIVAFLLSLFPGSLTALPPAPRCGCGELLSALVANVEATYPGYHLEVRSGPSVDAYRRHRATSQARASTAGPGIECVRVLQDFVAWFQDGHLFVGGSTPLVTAADSQRARDPAPRSDLSLAAALERFDSSSSLDPAEGLWLDPAGLRLAVIRQDATPGLEGLDTHEEPPGPHHLVAVVVESGHEEWQEGDVRAELTPLPDGSYDVILYDHSKRPTRPHVYTRGLAGGGRLQRDGLLLHMPPATWGKLHPVAPGLEGRIDPLDPRAPTARTVGSEAVVLQIPSHVPSHRGRLQLLIDQYRSALSRSRILVIDLRGNEGGSASATDALMPLVMSEARRPARYLGDGDMAVLVSEENVAHFSSSSWAPEGLVRRLQDGEPGTLVPFLDPSPDVADGEGRDPTGEDLAAGPPNVAILVDRMTVSAAEAFVLRAMRSEKVTLFGEPTGSSIDYQSVSIVRFGCREAGLYLGYPTVVGSDELPRGGVRPTGIVPDVLLDPREPDPVARVLEHYRPSDGGAGAVQTNDPPRASNRPTAPGPRWRR